MTYPQCPVSRDRAWEALRTNLLAKYVLAPVGGVVAEEKHESGDPHLHCAIDMGVGNRLDVRDARVFDIDGYHPNVQVCKNWRNVVMYVTKDMEWTQFGDCSVESVLAKKSSVSGRVAEMVQKGTSMGDIMDAEPAFCLLHMRQIEEFRRVYRMTHPTADDGVRPSWRCGVKPAEVTCVGDWLKKAIDFRLGGDDWSIGDRGLWLHGRPGIGKTTFINTIAEVVPCWFGGLTGGFCEGLEPSFCRWLVFDDFDGGMPLATFLQLTGGGNAVVNVKGGSVTVSRHRPCVVLSNLFPRQCYPNVVDTRVEAIERRFIVCTLEGLFFEWLGE